MKKLRRFFDHTRAHESAKGLVKPLLISLVLSMVMIMLVAPLPLTLACFVMLTIALVLHWFNTSVSLFLSYGFGGVVLFGLRSTLPNGVASPEFIACVFCVLALAQSMKLKTYWHCQLFLIWLLASNGTAALLDESATLSVWVTLVMFLNLTQFLRLHVKDFSMATLTNSLRSAIRTTVYTLPMLLIFIYVFHRSNENRHQYSDTTISGVSASLEPGRVSKLSMRSGVAYRVALDRPIPPLIDKYWKVATLSRSKGMKWSRQPHENEFMALPRQPQKACLLEQTVFSQQSTAATEFLALDRPIEGSFRRSMPVRISSYVCSVGDADTLTDADRARNLAVETDVSEQTKKLIDDLGLKKMNALGKANVIIRYFKKQHFKYTLQPAELPETGALENFLFGTKEGFCEHYAAALATLLRIAGVPARVVVGFQGGLYNHFGKYWLISYQDAHAWVEFWNLNQWQRIDPVAVLAPNQLRGHRDSMSLVSRLGALPGVEGAWLAVDSLIFNAQQIFSGREKVLALNDLTLDPFLALGSLVVLLLVLQLKKLWQPIEVVVQEQFRDLCLILEAKGVRRERAEGYESYRRRVVGWLREQKKSERLENSLNELFESYLSYRFGKLDYGRADLKKLIASTRKMKKEINRNFRFNFGAYFKRAGQRASTVRQG